MTNTIRFLLSGWFVLLQQDEAAGVAFGGRRRSPAGVLLLCPPLPPSASLPAPSTKQAALFTTTTARGSPPHSQHAPLAPRSSSSFLISNTATRIIRIIEQLLKYFTNIKKFPRNPTRTPILTVTQCRTFSRSTVPVHSAEH